MFADLLSAHYDSYNPEYSLTLVNSLKSYINLKLDHEKKTFNFIKDVQRRLYFIHEYNCQVAKVTHKYPRTRTLDLLLIKYVELEFDVLYNHSYVSRQLEEETELRVLRLLQVILYPAVLSNQPLINRSTDRSLKKAVLELLGEVRATYLAKNRLVYNIAQKLLKRIGGTFKQSHYNGRSGLDNHGNLTTSDYGSDDSDCDFETNLNELSARGPQFFNKEQTDCVEVPLTTNGKAPVPTVEFTDDDDNYFIYLQKPASSKRKYNDFKSDYRKKNLSSKSPDLVNARFKQEKSNGAPIENSSCVVICSDSEDEVTRRTSDVQPTKRHNKQQNTKKNVGVVTFEILDDDDDSQTNYMVYLQKEVDTNRRSKKEKKCTSEIVICSDSDDDTEKAHPVISPKTTQKQNGVLLELQEQSSSNNPTVPLIQADSTALKDINADVFKISNKIPAQKSSLKNELNKGSNRNDTINNGVVNPTPFSTDDDIKIENVHTTGIMPSNQQIDVQMPSTSTGVNTYALSFLDQVTTTNETQSTNYLIDPSIIFQQMNPTIEDQEGPLTNQLQVASALHVEFDGADIPGGPVMSEKVDSFEELANVSDCRINESLLEELLLDDTYLLEGRKEFEELEYFLFNDSSEKAGFYFSNNSLISTETVSQPETFDADVKSLESFLDDSQLINWTDCENTSLSSFDSIKNELVNFNSSDVGQHSNHRKTNEKWERDKRDTPCARKKDSKIIFKHGRRISRR